MFFFRVIIFASIFSGGSVFARMYQWSESDTGITQLSGKPPAHYRSKRDGPRIFVFENGRLIDDTGIMVSDDVSKQLRQQAFTLVKKNKQNIVKNLVKVRESKTEFSLESESKTEVNEEKEEVIPEAFVLPSDFRDYKQKKARKIAEKEASDVDELRKLIAEWEKDRSEKAKKILKEN